MKSLPALILALSLLSPAPLLHADDASDRTAAANDLITSMHMEKMIDQMKQNMIKMIGSGNFSKDLSPEARQQFAKTMSDTFDTFLKWDTLKPDYIQIYSEVYTAQELKDLAAFYKSPIGQKFTEKMPELQQKSMEIMQKRVIALMPDLKKIHDQAKAAQDAAPGTPAAPAPAPASTP